MRAAELCKIFAVSRNNTNHIKYNCSICQGIRSSATSTKQHTIKLSSQLTPKPKKKNEKRHLKIEMKWLDKYWEMHNTLHVTIYESFTPAQSHLHFSYQHLPFIENVFCRPTKTLFKTLSFHRTLSISCIYANSQSHYRLLACTYYFMRICELCGPRFCYGYYVMCLQTDTISWHLRMTEFEECFFFYFFCGPCLAHSPWNSKWLSLLQISK